MDNSKFIIFLIIISAILVFFDAYFLISWTKFSKKRNFKKITYYVPWFISGVMLAMSLYSTFSRDINEVADKTSKILFIISSIWFMPKLLIVPIMILVDLVKLISYIIIRSIRFIKYQNGTNVLSPYGKYKSIRIIKNIGWVLTIVPFIIYIHGLLFTTYDYEIKSLVLQMNSLPKSLDGLKVVQISDIHAGSYLDDKPAQYFVMMINNLKPDIIAITGDFVNSNPDEFLIVNDELKLLRSEYGVFACLGNHDHYMNEKQKVKLKELIKNTGIDLLVNENKILKIKGETLQIAGIDNSSFQLKFGDVNKTLEGLTPGYPTILLCHDPKMWENEIMGKTFVDLTLSGHTHAGQVSLDFTGNYFIPAMWVLKHVAGLYKFKDQHLYVNVGIGTAGPPIRIGIRPEITLITLKSVENFTNQ